MLTLAQFFDYLPLLPLRFDIRRSDEISGGGDGRIWQAELAPPLWVASAELRPMGSSAAEDVAARIRALRGAQETFLFRDPFRCYPRSDPGGTIIGESSVMVAAIGADRTTISIDGSPAGYVISPGDKLQITAAGDATRVAFLEAGAVKAADGTGVSGLFAVFPNVPAWVSVDDPVALVRPACKCVLVPGSHNPGSQRGSLVLGQSFQVIQKK